MNLLRGWIDKTRTYELIYSTINSPYNIQMDCSVISQDLCNKIERIYSDFGKYLYRYACSNAQILINKFQNALEVRFKIFYYILRNELIFFILLLRYLIKDLQVLKNSLNMPVI